MIKKLFAFMLLVSTFSVFCEAQNSVAPDYEKIEQEINSQSSGFYYPKLWERFSNGDSLSVDEARHLYYGNYFWKNENDFVVNSDTIKKVRAFLQQKNHSKQDCENIIKLVAEVIKADPFDLRSLMCQSYAYDILEMPRESQKVRNKIRCIVNALYSTGNGATKESAIHVLNVGNEYDVLFINAFQMTSQSLIEHYDYLKIRENEYGLEGLWFDITYPLKELNDMFK
ncbi:MAG: DUF4919 domain-containing protein [Prevotellaceae bacterium]|jgi:hypothetical protein|nr:DUF4919 domain-containing protein [Prevotellaceae bacterium]